MSPPVDHRQHRANLDGVFSPVRHSQV
ncbi:hypothetical protein FG05_35296 [Fusarium graminearum]|nr:hypothetical protein FG05_35296 [Fusarium graminearum]